MRKVLFVIHSLGGGGAEKVLVNIVNGLDPHEFDVTVMTIVDSGFHRGELPPTVQYKTLFSLPHAQGRDDAGIGGVSGSLLAGKNLIKRPLAALYMLLWKIMPSKLLYRMKIIAVPFLMLREERLVRLRLILDIHMHPTELP